MGLPAVFIDDGGVMSENAPRSAQWQALVADFFVPRLGGDPLAWGPANHVAAVNAFRAYDEHFQANPHAACIAFLDDNDEFWLREMCQAVGVAAPADSALRLQLSRECQAYVTCRIRAAFPGASDAIRELYAAGYTLRTASGETSWELDGYVTSMGVRDCFAALYGTDVIDTVKYSRLYYERLFVHAGVAPDVAVVVDDAQRNLNRAAELGARTVLCHVDPPENPQHDHIRLLAELPQLLRRGK